jgi:hypothetical protein
LTRALIFLLKKTIVAWQVFTLDIVLFLKLP